MAPALGHPRPVPPPSAPGPRPSRGPEAQAGEGESPPPPATPMQDEAAPQGGSEAPSGRLAPALAQRGTAAMPPSQATATPGYPLAAARSESPRASHIQDVERRSGSRIDDLAKALLRYRVVRGPARRLANSRAAWALVSRIDRIRARRARERVRRDAVPRHVGIIMDGNRRFAQQLGLDDLRMGHVAGQERLETVLDWCLELEIRVLTVYAFSTENFLRADAERELLMELFEHNFRKMADDPRVHRNRIRVRCIGDLSLLPASVRDAAQHVMEATKSYGDYTFNVAVAYGGRAEIVDAVRRIAADVRDGRLATQDITDATISDRLYTANLPDPDFIIRTSGEERISNFLLWQMAYAELYFADVYWPELSRLEFLRAIEEFQRRRRRFGA